MSRRIFKTDNAELPEFYLLEMDEDFITFQKYVYGHKVSEVARGVYFLEEKFPDYRDFTLEDLRDNNPYNDAPKDLSPLAQLAASRGIDMNARQRDDWSGFFNDIIEKTGACTEVTDDCEFSPVLKMVYCQTSVMIVPFLNGVTSVTLDEVSLAEAEAQYKRLRDNYHTIKPQILQLLYEQFEEIKEDVERNTETRWDRKLDAQYFPEVENAAAIEDVISPESMYIFPTGFNVFFNTCWETEHGANFSIDNDFNVTMN